VISKTAQPSPLARHVAPAGCHNNPLRNCYSMWVRRHRRQSSQHLGISIVVGLFPGGLGLFYGCQLLRTCPVSTDISPTMPPALVTATSILSPPMRMLMRPHTRVSRAGEMAPTRIRSSEGASCGRWRGLVQPGWWCSSVVWIRWFRSGPRGAPLTNFSFVGSCGY
jgi:hypothetical protein